MSGFDFSDGLENVEAFYPATAEVLPKGNYIVRIHELENVTSSGGYPMLKLVLENEQGRQWDNLVISPNEFSKARLAGLINSAGIPGPSVPEDMNPQDGRLTDAYTNRLLGRSVGLIVRDEEDNRPEHAGEWRPRVRGYVKPDVLAASGSTGPLGGSASASPSANGPASSGLAF
jgi:hypothetical protein